MKEITYLYIIQQYERYDKQDWVKTVTYIWHTTVYFKVA